MEYHFLQEEPIFMTQVVDYTNNFNILTSLQNNNIFKRSKTNTCTPIIGIREPLIIVMPQSKPDQIKSQETETKQKENDSLVSLLDIMPTILDWHNVTIPSHLTGKSLLPYLGTFSIIP